jgi:hypothetical protein
MLVRGDVDTDLSVRDDEPVSAGLVDDRKTALLRGARSQYTVDLVAASPRSSQPVRPVRKSQRSERAS